MIGRSFFKRDPLACAHDLIGVELRWGACAGRVVETEAYSSIDDEACHTFMRPSARKFVAQYQPGAAYVYLNYGMHWLLNVLVKGESGEGFVLIRALEPTRGLAQMRRRRGLEPVRSLCSGPGKLAQALGVRGAQHGVDLCASKRIGFVFLEEPGAVLEDVRIGISKAAHLRWRFLQAGSPFVSVRPTKEARPADRPGF